MHFLQKLISNNVMNIEFKNQYKKNSIKNGEHMNNKILYEKNNIFEIKDKLKLIDSKSYSSCDFIKKQKSLKKTNKKNNCNNKNQEAKIYCKKHFQVF